MEVTRELIKKYLRRECSEEERQHIEKWLESEEGEKAFPDESKLPQLASEMWKNISEDMESHDQTPVIPLHHRVVRYAAAACVIFAAFFGGRFSTGTVNATPTPADPWADHLFIVGDNGVKGNLPGDVFKVGFEGTIKLYNSSMAQKTIQVGDTSFALDPHQVYYLNGNTANPRLRDQSMNKLHGQPESLEGDFSIRRIKK
ncbi:MAG: hypothetical protein AAGA02_04400 [Bacteroidota bacterium]